ncbi:MAG: ATP-binding protein [Actinomycetota bacterium]
MVPLTDIEERRGRLLVSVFAVLGAFATVSVLFSLLGPDFLAPLLLTPTAARVGVLVLTIGFIALVWEKERHFGDLSQTVTRQEILLAAFENRIRVVESLLEATNRLNAPIAVDDVLNVVLEAAVELVGAESGSIELEEDDAGHIKVARAFSTEDNAPHNERRVFVRFPLIVDESRLGVLTLTMPRGATGFDDATFEVLERFTAQAAHALQKAHFLAQERATVAYLEAANVVKARFLTSVSHELRTPLTSVIGFSSTLDRHWDQLQDAERRDFVEETYKQAQKLGSIVEWLLEAARDELQGIVVDPVLHDVRQSMTNALESLSGIGRGRLIVDMPGHPVEAELDPFVVDQVVWNLVDNALRYTNGRVRVAIEPLPHEIVIKVRDDGPGIDPALLEAVMDPFYRTNQLAGHGEGMGLHIVRTLIESHGGRAQIDSDPQGTFATVALPRVAATSASSRILDPIVS